MKKVIAVLMSIIFIQTQAAAMSLGFVIEVNIMTNIIQNKKEVIVNSESINILRVNNIELNAKEGRIGTSDNSIRIGGSPDADSHSVLDTESTLNAKAEEGINIESSDTIIVSKIETPEDVRVETEESVYAKEQENKESNITAENIEVHAGANVGEQDGRLIVETLHNKDSRVNLEANGEIYIEQSGNKNVFYSDYVINHGDGTVDLLLPDNHAYIVNLDIANPNKFKIDFTNLKYKKEINIGHSSIERLTIHPKAVRQNKYEEETDAESKYNLLKDFKENITIHPDVLSPLKQPVLPKLISKLQE